MSASSWLLPRITAFNFSRSLEMNCDNIRYYSTIV